jgi:hypothetical protein
MRTATLVLAVLVPALAPACARAAAEAVRKSGPCTLQEAGAFEEGKHFKVTFGKALQARCGWYIDEFFGKKIIQARATVANRGEKRKYFHYYVAFFDKDGNLVGCAGQGALGDKGLEPRSEMQLGSCLIPLPPEKFQEVAAYKAVLYESDTGIGK